MTAITFLALAGLGIRMDSSKYHRYSWLVLIPMFLLGVS